MGLKSAGMNTGIIRKCRMGGLHCLPCLASHASHFRADAPVLMSLEPSCVHYTIIFDLGFGIPLQGSSAALFLQCDPAAS